MANHVEYWAGARTLPQTMGELEQLWQAQTLIPKSQLLRNQSVGMPQIVRPELLRN
jgi:hypothetical protein